MLSILLRLGLPLAFLPVTYTHSSSPPFVPHVLPTKIRNRNWPNSFTVVLLLQCDPGVGVDTFFHALYTQKSTRMLMLLGTACSDVTESLAKVTPYWNIVQVISPEVPWGSPCLLLFYVKIRPEIVIYICIYFNYLSILCLTWIKTSLSCCLKRRIFNRDPESKEKLRRYIYIYMNA
jgi:hypothetical protein